MPLLFRKRDTKKAADFSCLFCVPELPAFSCRRNYALLTRSAYSPVRVSILTMSPWLMKSGTWIS